ncbi:MAG: hypothetical protein KatS3mg009_2968 [Acidimicrobiia bacterium]|nr:MAG: hypothetical protein KatS3mg009_2968 [Acidimicrobiia bacterium]
MFPVRLRYAKRGRVRFLGHRDVARALERAFRVTQLPLAFTEGFSPRPRVSFGLALSTGYESDAEYLDVQLARPVDLDALPGSLTEALPEGISVTGAAALAERAPALQEAVTSVEWSVGVARADGSDRSTSRRWSDRGGGRARGRVPAGPAYGARVVRSSPTCGRPSGRSPSTAPPSRWSCTPDPSAPSPRRCSRRSAACSEVRVLRTHQWIERDGARLEPLDADTRPRAPEARAS